jgi:GH35 family endo-1,4-beta-xylanase/Spy/CpxP family protein refolding chaperone
LIMRTSFKSRLLRRFALPIFLLWSISSPRFADAQTAAALPVDQHGPTIKDTYKGHFLIGTAADVPGGFTEQDLQLIKENFNIITPENYLKPGAIHPTENIWSFARTDALVKWCQDNNVAVHGHTLAWHAQTNPWFFEGGDKETVAKRLQDHITALVGHYKGKIYSWDVVNEAINDSANAQTENLRPSQWTQIIGPSFLTIAFKAAHVADPDAKLYYNDYGIENGAKHESSMLLLKRLIEEGAPVNGVGIQGHWSTSSLPYTALDKALADYASLGLKVSISELDITIAGSTGGQLNGGAAPPAGRGAGAAGGRGGRGGAAVAAAQPSVANTPDSMRVLLTDLTDEQKAKLAAASQDLDAKLNGWQTSSQEALLVVQPQYTPGQLAYEHEISHYNAVRAQQELLRDGIVNEAEIAMVAVLTPAQTQAWAKARLKEQALARLGSAGLTEAQSAKADSVVAAHAPKIIDAKDKAALIAAKADFWKDIVGILNDAQLTMLLTPAQDGSAGRGGRTPQLAPAQALKAQADAYARLFTILEKHKDVVERVTFWGLNDRRSWRTGQNPLIFDVNNQRKPAYESIVYVLLHPELP